MPIRGVTLSIKDLTHRYNSKCPLTFDKVNIEAEPGEALIIIGRSGCGKSTLLHIIAGLLGSTSGTLHLNNEAVKKPSSRWVMMFQAPHLFPWLTVEQMLALVSNLPAGRKKKPVSALPKQSVLFIWRSLLKRTRKTFLVDNNSVLRSLDLW